ncbi:MAG: alpha-ketoglutarate-dependent dioxygenase AlkB [Halioglobus sp.]
MTRDLFSAEAERSDTVCRVDLPDAEIFHYAALFSENEALQLFARLRRDIAWQQDTITLYGRHHPVPRLTAWYGDPGKTYAYSGIAMRATPWTPALLAIKARIERMANYTFNSVLLNLYRNGADSVAWHADDEPELGRNPVIGSVSLGASRSFQLRHKTDKNSRHSIDLHSGSFLLMQGSTQHQWLHQIPKTARKVGERINLTYRRVS